MSSGTTTREFVQAHTARWCRGALARVLGMLVVLSFLAGMPGVSSAAIDEDDLLLLDIVLDRQRLARSVTAYSYGDTAVVSLAEFASALEFPIAVDPETRRASGWFLRPERTFSLDLDAGAVDVDGRRVSISADDAMLHDDAIFVTVDALARWFPVDLRLQVSSLAIEVEPRERLPVQERQARRREASRFAGVGPATLPRIETPYRLLGPHAADIGLGYSIRRQRDSGRPTTGLSYSALLAGDVAYMDSRIYLGGNREDALSSLRASLSRDNIDGPLGLRYVEIGDIVPAIVPGMRFSGVERGLLIQGGGSATGRDDLIDTDNININGDALEGWDVELLQNGMRVGFQTIGSDGRYNFTDIPPLSGENTFELVFYGPSGERRTETVTRYGGLAPDQPGSVRYQVSVSQKGKQLYEGSEGWHDDLSNRGTSRMAAGMEVRVLPRLALRGSWNSLVVDGERLNYTSVGARAGVGPVTLGLDATRDPLGGTRWDASIHTPGRFSLGGFDTRFTHTQYARSSLVEDEYEVRLQSRTALILTRPFGQTATRFGLLYDREYDRNSAVLSAGFTHRMDSLSFGNNLNYRRYSRARDGIRDPDMVDGDMFFTFRANPLSVRGGINYELSPDARARQYFIDSNLRVANDMTMTFGLEHTPRRGLLSSRTRYISGLNWQLPQVTLSPRVTYDSNGEYSGFLYASFSLAPGPDGGVMFSRRSLASDGAVAARVFLDNDDSGTFTAGDEPLPNVVVRAPQAYRNAETGADGTALLTSMPSITPTDVVLEPDTLPGIGLTSTHAGNSVRPRPTAVALVDFPVVRTGEVDGRVYALQQGMRSPRSGVLVELRDSAGELVAFRSSGHDGYFVFEGVPLGSYTVTVDSVLRPRLKAERRVTLSREKGVASGVELEMVVPTRAPGATPASIAPSANRGTATPAAPRADPMQEAVDRIRAAPAAAARVSAPPARPTARNAEPPARPPVSSRISRAPGRDGRLAQLGSFADASRAQGHVDGLIARGLLSADRVEVVSADLGSRGVFHRILVSPGSAGTADALCRTLKARGEQCVPVAP